MILEHAPGLDQASLLTHALDYARRGWSIIPVKAKKAAGLWKPFQTQAPDAQTLRRNFARPGITGLAVILGEVSGGLACRDFDQAEAYETWANANPDYAAKLPTVKSGRGYHIYGRLEEEAYAAFADGELRGNAKHYTVLPPSAHPHGGTYTWLNPLPDRSKALPLLPPSLRVQVAVVLQEYTEELTNQTQDDPATPVNPLHVSQNLLGESQIPAAIARTLPTGAGQRNRRIFDLARILKGLLPAAKPDDLRLIVREWHRLALPRIRTKDFAETWSDFVIAWEAVRRPAGRLLRNADPDSSIPPTLTNRYDGGLLGLAVLCLRLQRQHGELPFFLSCRKAGETLSISKTQAWRFFKTLQFDGVLELTLKGKQRGQKASEWRFTGGES